MRDTKQDVKQPIDLREPPEGLLACAGTYTCECHVCKAERLRLVRRGVRS